ncbi:hypothetical protein MTO96_042778 [Rhipicephalus appendiculatus]
MSSFEGQFPAVTLSSDRGSTTSMTMFTASEGCTATASTTPASAEGPSTTVGSSSGSRTTFYSASTGEQVLKSPGSSSPACIRTHKSKYADLVDPSQPIHLLSSSSHGHEHHGWH